MSPGVFYGWNSPDLADDIVVDCFLPTGVLVPLKCSVSASLGVIKTRLFKEAERYPLFGRLGNSTQYCFLCINEKGKREEILDEELKLTDVRPFRPVLKLLERQGEHSPSDRKLDAKIKYLMGKTPAELDGKVTEEVLGFRQKYFKIAILESQLRRTRSWMDRAMATFPSELCDDQVPEFVSQKLRKGHFELEVCLPPGNEVEVLNIPLGILPADVIYVFRSRSNPRMDIIVNIKDYVLKIIGKEEYFLGDRTMEEYKVRWFEISIDFDFVLLFCILYYKKVSRCST